MTTIQFYHLTATQLDRALPKLMEKALAGGFRSLIVTDTPERADYLDDVLWTYDASSFLPHGTAKNSKAAAQPVLISTEMETANHASLLVITDGRMPEQPENWARILDIFDGRNDAAVASARTRWTSYKAAGHGLSYLKQTESGGWQQPASQ